MSLLFLLGAVTNRVRKVQLNLNEQIIAVMRSRLIPTSRSLLWPYNVHLLERSRWTKSTSSCSRILRFFAVRIKDGKTLFATIYPLMNALSNFPKDWVGREKVTIGPWILPASTCLRKDLFVVDRADSEENVKIRKALRSVLQSYKELIFSSS